MAVPKSAATWLRMNVEISKPSAVAAVTYNKAAKQRVRRVRDNVPYNEGEKMMLKPGSAWMVEGSAEQFTKAYNSLVEASNRLN